MAPVFERFTDEARQVVVMASEEAREIPHDYIGTEHLLLGLLRVDESVGFWALNAAGISLDSARRSVRRLVGATEEPQGQVPFTERAKKALENGFREAVERGEQTVGSGHLLLGLLREPHGVAVDVINDHEVALATLRQRVVAAMGQRPESLIAKEGQPLTPVRDADRQLIEMALRLDQIDAKLDEVLRRLPRPS
jgi:ATP-dependent Clp protease ATP-binding subunit ClpC